MASSCVAPPPGLEAMSVAKVEPKAFEEKMSGIAAPPGLEDFLPAKVTPVQPSVSMRAEAPPYTHGSGVVGVDAQSHPGLWANAVLAASPHLTPEGLHQALAIVDKAIKNAQHAKALDELIGAYDPMDWNTSPYVKSAACLRAQISTEQLQLLGQLQQLSAHCSELEGVPATVPLPSVAPASTVIAPSAPAPLMEVMPLTTQMPAARAPKASPQAGKVPERAGEKPSNRGAQTLSTSLQLLSQEDPECLLIVRHINKLGFKASRTLKRHFSAYGTVVRVLVAHSTVRQHGSPDCLGRRRPSSLGFMQMAAPEAVRAILAAGPEQEVDGVAIRVQKFERQQAQQGVPEEERADEQARWAFERGTSSGSDNSVATASTGISEESYSPKGSSVEDDDEE